MADYSKTISNSIRSFGPGPATKWGVSSLGTMVWGTSKWGENSFDPVNEILKIVSESQTIDSAIGSRAIEHLVNMGSLSLDSLVAKYLEIAVNFGAISPEMETFFESLTQGSWSYVYPSNITDLESRYFPTYTEASAGNTSFSSASPTSTVWS